MREYNFIIALLVVKVGMTFSQQPIGLFNSQIDSLKNEILKTSSVEERAHLYYLIASFYGNSNPDSSILYAEKCIELANQLGHSILINKAKGNIAGGLRNKGNLPKALELALSVISNESAQPLAESGIGHIYSVLGNIYNDLEDHEKAISYYKQLIKTNSKDVIGVAYGHYYLADTYEKLNRLDSALFHLRESYDLFKEFKDYKESSNVYPPWHNVRAKVYLKQQRPDMALVEFRNILRVNVSKGEALITAETYNDIAHFFSTQNMPDSSIYYAKKALTESEKIDYVKGKLDACKILAENSELIDPVNALVYYKLATSIQNSLYGAGNIQVLKEMIAQDAKKREEIEAAKVEFNQKLRIYALIGLTLILLTIAIFLFRNNKQEQKAKQKIEEAYQQLKSTQAQLIQSEKMASLGELTAGIAHEIQNPLNFVNNFSELTEELVEELEEEGNREPDQREKGLDKELMCNIRDNLKKINHHGTRASSIVKNMLEHAKTGSGDKVRTDINALVDEYLKLAYHACLAGREGLQTKEKDFNFRIVTDFDLNLPKVNVIPQDIGRVLLNLLNNAFYACMERNNLSDSAGQRSDNSINLIRYAPIVSVSTKMTNGEIKISMEDNGIGVPDEVKDKIFQPFFTTKPTGQGTGLGLSLAYDIVKAHGGELVVETKEGEGSAFMIKLPVA